VKESTMTRGELRFTVVVVLLAMVVVSCAPHRPSEQAPPRVLVPPAPDTDGVLRVLLYYDMEGVSGLDQVRGLFYPTEEYTRAREWLTNDVNAVVDGLFAGGADAVDVVDAHGSGNPEPDILLDRMDSRARLVVRREAFRTYVDLTEEGVYDAVAAVCMHSKTGGGGFAAHTGTVGMDWILNDMSVNETEIIAYSWGRVSVPVVFASGDDRLRQQLAWMPWLEYVEVKKAEGAGDAELRPFEEVHAEMRTAAERAVENLADSRAVRLRTPIKAQLRAVHPASLNMLANVPGIAFADQTVTFEAADFEHAYDGIEALMGVAMLGWDRVLERTIGDREDGSEIQREFMESMVSDWVAVESGKWSPPSVPGDETGQSEFFGAR